MDQSLCSVKCQLEDSFNVHSVKIFLGFIGGISCQVPAEILHEINKKTGPGFEILLQSAQGKLKILTQDLQR